MLEYKRSRLCDNNQVEKATAIAPELTGYEFVNIYDLKNRNKTYRPGTNDFSISLDMGMSTNISFFGLFGKSDSPFGISDQAVITVRASMIDFFDGNEPFIQTIPVDELGAYGDISNSTDTQGISYRYWQIDINDEYNSDPLEIAYMYLGDHINFSYNLNVGFSFEQRDLTRSQRSDSGKIFTSRKPQQRNINGLGVNYIGTKDRKKSQAMIDRIGIHTPFLLVLDPTECTFEYDFSCTLVYFTRKVPVYTHVVKDLFNINFTCEEVL